VQIRTCLTKVLVGAIRDWQLKRAEVNLEATQLALRGGEVKHLSKYLGSFEFSILDKDLHATAACIRQGQ
jgi:hypothetical protein